MVPACGARRFEWAALLVPKRLPLLVDGTRGRTVSSAEVLWLAPDTGDVPRVAIAMASCKKAGSGGFGACFAEFSRKDGAVRLGHDLSASGVKINNC